MIQKINENEAIIDLELKKSNHNNQMINDLKDGKVNAKAQSGYNEMIKVTNTLEIVFML